MAIHVRTRAEVAVPAAEAWGFLSVYANDPLWRQGVSAMIQTPPGAVVDGAETDETLRMFGRTMRNIAHLSDVRAGHSFAWRVSGNIDANGTRQVVPIDDGRCEIVIEKTVRLRGLDRVLQPVVALVLRRTEARDTRRLARLLEKRYRTATG